MVSGLDGWISWRLSPSPGYTLLHWWLNPGYWRVDGEDRLPSSTSLGSLIDFRAVFWNSYLSIEEERQSGASSAERTVTCVQIYLTLFSCFEATLTLSPWSGWILQVQACVELKPGKSGDSRTVEGLGQHQISCFIGHLYFLRCSSVPSKLGLLLDMLKWLTPQKVKGIRAAGSKDRPPSQDELCIKERVLQTML